MTARESELIGAVMRLFEEPDYVASLSAEDLVDLATSLSILATGLIAHLGSRGRIPRLRLVPRGARRNKEGR